MSWSIFNLKDKFIPMGSIFFVMAFFYAGIALAANSEIISDIAKKYKSPVEDVAGLTDAVSDSVRLREVSRSALTICDIGTAEQVMMAAQNMITSLDKITKQALIAGNMVVLSKVMEIKSNIANSLGQVSKCAAKLQNTQLGDGAIKAAGLVLNDMDKIFDWASLKKGGISSKIADNSLKTIGFLSDITGDIANLAEKSSNKPLARSAFWFSNRMSNETLKNMDAALKSSPNGAFVATYKAPIKKTAKRAENSYKKSLKTAFNLGAITKKDVERADVGFPIHQAFEDWKEASKFQP